MCSVPKRRIDLAFSLHSNLQSVGIPTLVWLNEICDAEYNGTWQMRCKKNYFASWVSLNVILHLKFVLHRDRRASSYCFKLCGGKRQIWIKTRTDMHYSTRKVENRIWYWSCMSNFDQAMADVERGRYVKEQKFY